MPLDLSPFTATTNTEMLGLQGVRPLFLPVLSSGGMCARLLLAGGMFNITTRIHKLLLVMHWGMEEKKVGAFWRGKQLEGFIRGFSDAFATDPQVVTLGALR